MIRRVWRRTFELFRPPPKITITEWAEQHRVLSRENCALPGPYRVDVTPFLREILDTISDPAIERIVCQKSAQVAWTDGVINNTVAFYMDHDPSPMMILFPSEAMAEKYSKSKLSPMVRDTPRITDKLSKKSRDSSNTLLNKYFLGGSLTMVGSNAPSQLSSSPIRVLFIEEPDRCAHDSGKEGSPIKLSIERTKTFHNRKMIIGGSPTIHETSHIRREMELSDKRRYHIPCPHCGTMHALEWTMVKWDKDPNLDHEVFRHHVTKSARIVCPACAGEYSNQQKNEALAYGKWVAEREFTGVAGFFLNELYSPFPKATLQHVVEKFLEAKKAHDAGDPTLMVTWTNTALGECWKETGETVAWEELRKHQEEYENEVPDGVNYITAAVDVQDDRFEIEVCGWGVGEESWSIKYDRLFGDLSRAPIWAKLAEALNETFVDSAGLERSISLVCIDSGGHYTDEVYAFSRKMGPLRVIPTKGASEPGKRVATFPRRMHKQHKVYLTMLGTENAKEIIYKRYSQTVVGPGYCHYPINDDYDDDYFKGSTCETKIIKYKNGHPYFVWSKPSGARNEPLDLRVMNYAAVKIAQDHRGVKLDRLRRGGAPTKQKTRRTQQATKPETVETPQKPQPMKRTATRRRLRTYGETRR